LDEASRTAALGDTVLHTVEDGVARITLNKPAAANALSPDQRELIIDLLAQADADTAVRVVVLGAAGKFFCSGADIRGIANTMAGQRVVGQTIRNMMTGVQKLIAALLDCGKPVIAAVQGPALGLGAHMAYACDLIVASEAAYFQEPFVQRGISVDSGGAYLLPRRIGLQKAKELVFFGDRLSAAEAAALGLVNKVAPESEFAAAVDDYARRLAASATLSVSLAKRQLNLSLDGSRMTAFLEEAMAQEINGNADDASEGVKAFIEKRQPQFKGH
jgi:2-(1,2-epoxy-1,2-dihydrophenyl)acetyl-CoA isomerase